MTTPFARENRYYIIKHSDFAQLSNEDQAALNRIMQRLHVIRTENGKRPLKCVVVEDDWPEYEFVWKLIEQRVAFQNETMQRKP